MSYFGSVAHMINSLKYNNSLLKKSGAFEHLKKHFENRVENNAKIKGVKISDSELDRIKKEIKEKLKKERKYNNIFLISLILATIFVSILLIHSFFFTDKFMPTIVNHPSEIEDKEYKKKERENIKFYLEDGTRWLSEGHFHNAAHQFRLVIKYQEYNYEANLGLAKALLGDCKINDNSCNEAENQKMKLFNSFKPKEISRASISEYLMQLNDSAKTEKSYQISALEHTQSIENFVSYYDAVEHLKTGSDIDDYDYTYILLLDSSCINMVSIKKPENIKDFREFSAGLSNSIKTKDYLTDKKNIKEAILDCKLIKGDTDSKPILSYPIYYKDNKAVFELYGASWSDTYFATLENGTLKINWLSGVIE